MAGIAVAQYANAVPEKQVEMLFSFSGADKPVACRHECPGKKPGSPGPPGSAEPARGPADGAIRSERPDRPDRSSAGDVSSARTAVTQETRSMAMRILVVGGGGREHALVWKLSRETQRPDLFCAPGNAGTTEHATNLPIAADNLDGLTAWAQLNRPDLTLVGPESPLCAGLVDRFQQEKLRVFGPTQAAARLEGSKLFAKEIMQAAGVPTARAVAFDLPGAARDYVRGHGAPVVIKADGLAAGKGVAVCATESEAEAAIDQMLVQRVFGEAGARILVEECLTGEEASVLALVDGDHIVLLASAQDHKRVFDHDEGPNTGGMGAYSPAAVMRDPWWPVVREQIFQRVLQELRRRGIRYQGVLYAGLMMTDDGPKVLEFNCRFGDPETQALLPRWAGDMLPALAACVDGTLRDRLVQWKPEPCVSVVMAAGGYPGPYEQGIPITGLAEAAALRDVMIFHAGTARNDRNEIVTAGGRVLSVSALGKDLPAAITRAYDAVGRIQFAGAHFRKDIAGKALRVAGAQL
jgi:phosphoribosylamine--glycine ligase